MNLTDVMDELGNRLKTISGITVYPYEPNSIKEPAAIVDFPEGLQFDETYGRGSDRLTIPIHVLVNTVYDRIAKQRINKYIAGSGTQSFKEVLENGTYTSFDSLRVMSVTFNPIIVGQIEYKAATFLVDIFGRGE